jgi:hypothetical protein
MLRRKLRRDLARQRAQFAAVALTMLLGVACSASPVRRHLRRYRGLRASYQQAFVRYRFANLTIDGRQHRGARVARARHARGGGGAAARAGRRPAADRRREAARAGDRHALGERPKAGVGADEQTVLDPRRRTYRVVEHRSRLDIERCTERSKRLGRRGGQVLGDEAQPPQRAKLQRNPELVRGAPLRAHEHEVLACERKEADDVAAFDRLRKRSKPLSLGVGEKPARRQPLQ